MRRSKARDLSEVVVPVDPLHLPEYPFMLSVAARVGRDRRRFTMDFSYLEPLGRFGRQLVASFVTICRHLERPDWDKRERMLRPMLAEWARLWTTHPESWPVEQWKAVTDAKITEVFGNPRLADGTKRLFRTHVMSLLNAAFDAKIIHRFKVRPGIKSPVSISKPPIAEAPVIGNYPETDDPEINLAARTLELLSNVHDPDVHKKRHQILIKLLLRHCEQRIRSGWNHFWRAQKVIRGNGRFNVSEFVRLHVVDGETLSISEAGYALLRSQNDHLRVLAHPTFYKRFLFGGLPVRFMGRLSRKGGVNWYHEALHLTPNVATACEGLMLIDLNNEVSSVLRMKRGEFNYTEDKRVVRIGWFKGRSNEWQEDYRSRGTTASLAVDSQLPITSFTAARILNVMRRRLVPFAHEDHKDHLYLVAFHTSLPHSNANLLSSDRAQIEVQRLRADHPILSRHLFSFDKIRGSIIFDGHLQHGNLLKTKEKARHRSIGTTIRYVSRAAANIQSVEYIRELQDLLVLSVPAFSVVKDKIGISQQRADAILSRAEASGFLQWRTGKKKRSRSHVHRSAFKRFLAHGEIDLIEDSEIAAEIFAFRRHLLAEAPTIRGSPEWNEFWAPLLLMLNVAWSLFRPDIKLEAQRIAEDLQLEYMDAA